MRKFGLNSQPGADTGFHLGCCEILKRENYTKKGKKGKEDGKSITGSSIIKIILGILFEGFLSSILSVSGRTFEIRTI